MLLYQGPGIWVLEYLPWYGSICIFFEATLFAWVLLVCTSESEDVNFRAHSAPEQIQNYGFFFWERNDFTPVACPEPDLTAALSKVLKLLLSNADFFRHSALEPCPWSWALISLARPWLTLLGDFHLVPEGGNIVVLTRMWDQNWPQVFSPHFCFWERAALFNGIYRGGGRLHVPLGLFVSMPIPETQSCSVAGSWGGGGLWLAQDKPGQWFSNCLAEPQSFLGVASGVLGGDEGGEAEQAGLLALKQNSSPCSCLIYRGSG